ncbi:phosphonate ABC transporter, permease protein PhnE [Arcobacter sp. FWKO B]|uniref:phosphonate ABC transporter, permease protein PhnE n=1 Tax=Arcobacter sp. FWKO B TaxID=2593672 RepID=UPI0018A41D17|nr:phosphonate ABC transporter, permease protein PhnE [Arcobacter sp. FWKO B]QOG12342.1 phosphonate ABC transporter, permease protein PhnE [Arcobacter sp. FWKO B]
MDKQQEFLDLKKHATPFKAYNLMIIGALALVFLASWYGSEMSLVALYDGWGHMVKYLSGNPNIENSSFLPPSTNWTNIEKYLYSMLETVMMAVVALVISVILAFPMSLLGSRNIVELLFPGQSLINRFIKRTIYGITTLLANIFRSVNEIIWALIFVSAVGLGPMAGILALGIHTAGVLAKLLSEGIESIDPGPVNALNASGAGFIKILFYAIMPQTMPHFISMVLYRFESDVRAASVLGFVGAGGIGFYLFDAIRSFEHGDVTTILMIIVATVWVIDKISAYVRSKFI